MNPAFIASGTSLSVLLIRAPLSYNLSGIARIALISDFLALTVKRIVRYVRVDLHYILSIYIIVL